MKRTAVVFGILALVGSGGCEKTEAGTVVGKWELLQAGPNSSIIDYVTLDFFKDGTATLTENGETEPTGEYELIDGRNVQISIPELGAISGAISSSWNEMSLTRPSGRVGKYAKVEQIEKITVSAVAGDYVRVMRTPGVEDKTDLPQIVTWTEDGTERANLVGQWEAHDNLELDSYQFDVTGFLRLDASSSIQSTRIDAGQIKADMLYREPPTPSLKKQRGAKIIRKLEGENILWSDYCWSSGPSNGVTITLEIREDGTFKHILSLKHVWRIRDGKVEIHKENHLYNTDSVKGIDNEDDLVKGEIEGYTIVFRKDDGAELRYIRRSQQYLSRLETPFKAPPQITRQK